MAKFIYKDVLSQIQKEERKVALSTDNIIEECYKMIGYLQELLRQLKMDVLKHGFAKENEEIDFFKRIKPQILGKIVYYNKVSRIETTCPVSDGQLYLNYYSNQMKKLNKEFKDHILISDFYRYYKSGRVDKDNIYFRLGNINFYDGLNSFVFEIDTHFSTYYDYKTARIIANENLYFYLNSKICNNAPEGPSTVNLILDNSDIHWTDSKSALIELIYALYASASVSNGRISLTKLSAIAQELFNVQLGDIHHAFHRMKDRAGDRASFLNHLKNSLEQYMDKES